MVSTNKITGYRSLSQYSGLLGGTTGTLISHTIPKRQPSMAIVTLPDDRNGHKLELGALQHNQKDLSGAGYFNVSNAYGSKCTGYRKAKCGGQK